MSQKYHFHLKILMNLKYHYYQRYQKHHLNPKILNYLKNLIIHLNLSYH